MNSSKLTNPVFRVQKPHMGNRTKRKASGARLAVMLLGTIPVAGCIKLEAPSEPIVIELNINITQEVIYRLAESAGNTIDENADIF